MRHGSLFSGIGGFDLAADWMGWSNEFHCEWNEFGRKVLKYYWPKAKSYEDITKTDFTIHRGQIDILTGGFPCQPYSVAGKRKGKEDERHLWPEMLRAIREIKPKWVVGENVRGLINWNGGLVFEEVQADLEAEGYEVLPFILPACGINAPHRRDRIWFIAKNTNEDGWRSEQRQKESSLRGFGDTCPRDNERIPTDDKKTGDVTNTCKKRCRCRGDNRQERHIQNNIDRNAEENKSKGNGWECRTCKVGEDGDVTNTKRSGSEGELQQRQEQGKLRGCDSETAADTDNKRLERSEKQGSTKGCRTERDKQPPRFIRPNWENFPTQSPVCDGDDGLSSRLDGITFPKWRNESIKAGGNAIIPGLAFQIFKAIEAYEL